MSNIAKRARDEANRDDHRGAGLILRQCADEIERLNRAASPQREEIANKLDEIARKRGAVYLGEICTLAMADAILALFDKEK